MARRSSTFTTYLSVEEAKNVDPAFGALERKATTTFNRIAQQAAKASAAASGASVGRSVTISNNNVSRVQAASAAERAHAQALQRTTQASRAAEAASGRLAGKHMLESNAARAAAASTSQLERSLRLAAVAANVAQGPLGPVAGRLSAAATAVRELSGVRLGFVGAAAGVAAFARVASTVQDLKSQLRPLFDTQEQVNEAFAKTRRIADDARVGLEPVVSLYARLTLAGRDAGLSQQRISRITEIATKAARLSGGPAASQEAGLYQFSQGIGSGTLGGDELKSVRENTLRLAKALADGLNVPMAKLKELGALGKLTPKAIADALEKESARIDAELAKLPPTISSSVAKLDNAFKAMVDGTDEAFGVTTVLAGGLGVLANNLGLVTRAVVGLGIAYATIKTANVVRDNYTRIKAWDAERMAIQVAAREQVAATTTARRASADRIVSLRNERAALKEQVAAERALANETRARALGLGQQIQKGDYAVNNPREIQGYARAVDQARVAQDNLAASKNRLKSITGQLRTEFGGLTTTTTAWRTAAETAKRTSAGFGAAVKGALSAINPLGIALALGINLLIDFATREDAAAGAADRMAESQNRLAKFVDLTTGKLLEQNQALISNETRLLRQQATAADTAYKAQRREAIDLSLSTQATRNGVVQADPRIRAVIQQYRAGRTNAAGASRALEALGRNDGNLRKQADVIIERLSKTVDLAREKVSTEAQIRTLEQGPRSSAADRRLARGDFSSGRAISATTGQAEVKPRTRAQIEAAAAQEAATTGVARARADLKALRAQVDKMTGLLPGKTDVETQHELASAMQAVTAAQESQSAATKAASAARTAGRKAERDAIQDAKDLAAAKRDNALLDLQKRAPQLSQNEFLTQRLAIVKTYDDEINRIDSSAAASNRAAGQMIADLKAVQDQAAKGGEKRTDILANYDAAPKAMDKARDDARALQKLVDTAVDGIAEITDKNPLGTGIYTQAMADADKARIDTGLRQPLRDLYKEQAQGLQLSGLRLEGYDLEANALEKALAIQEQMGPISRGEFEILVKNEQQQLRINDALSSRQRQVQQILDLAGQTRDAFEDMLVGLSKDPLKALKNFGNQAIENVLRIRARQLTEKVFAGADEKLRDLVSGSNGVDRAAEILKKNVELAADSTKPLKAANDNLATATELAAKRITAAAESIAAGGPGQVTPTASPEAQAAEAVKDTTAGLGKMVTSLAGAVGGGSVATTVAAAAGGLLGTIGVGGNNAVNQAGDQGAAAAPGGSDEIVVIGARKGKVQVNQDTGPIPTGTQGFSKSIEGLGETLDKTFKSGTFFSGLGKGVGRALGGAATGTMVGGIMKAVGLKTSKTGAQLGGAIGAATMIPGGDIIGSIAGGIIGGLFKKTKKGYANNITVNADGSAAYAAGGNSASRQKTAGGLADSLGGQLQSIAEALGGGLNSGLNLGSLGQKKDKFTFDATPGTSAGKQTFDTQEEAIAAALDYAISKGVITGISQASQNILQSGQDLQRAITKATAIESIPKRLMQLTDPVKYAVTTLNDEFTKLISYLNEGKASAGQFADAQKLYDLERANAIEQATQQSVNALQAYLDEMRGGSSSPFNRKTVFDNASWALQPFRTDIAAGKSVDQEDFLTAVRNVQEAARNRYGSSSNFFSIFDDLGKLVEQAKTNVQGTGSSTLPGSPFDTPAVQAALSEQTKATTDGTATLGSKLDTLTAAVLSLNDNGSITTGALSSLRNFA
ncbi:MAG: tape measure protein [Rhizorhabdus sp.]